MRTPTAGETTSGARDEVGVRGMLRGAPGHGDWGASTPVVMADEQMLHAGPGADEGVRKGAWGGPRPAWAWFESWRTDGRALAVIDCLPSRNSSLD